MEEDNLTLSLPVSNYWRRYLHRIEDWANKNDIILEFDTMKRGDKVIFIAIRAYIRKSNYDIRCNTVKYEYVIDFVDPYDKDYSNCYKVKRLMDFEKGLKTVWKYRDDIIGTCRLEWD